MEQKGMYKWVGQIIDLPPPADAKAHCNHFINQPAHATSRARKEAVLVASANHPSPLIAKGPDRQNRSLTVAARF
jgi:hypothetical protein